MDGRHELGNRVGRSGLAERPCGSAHALEAGPVTQQPGDGSRQGPQLILMDDLRRAGSLEGGGIGGLVLARSELTRHQDRWSGSCGQLGDGSANYIPGDVWFQFWIYPQNYGNQRSRYGTRNKFLYVCNDAYPCHSHLWMVGQGSNVYSATNSTPLGDPSNGEFFWNMSSASGVSTIDYANGDPWSRDQLGQNTTEWMRANRWTLVKMRFRSNSTTANGWEVWLRPQGGFFIWVRLPDNCDPNRLADACTARGVSYVPGPGFYSNWKADWPEADRYIRLACSYSQPDEIRAGVAQLGRAILEASS